MKQRTALATLALAAFLASAHPASSEPNRVARKLPTQPNIIIVMTDDQRWDTLWAMPYVNKELRPLSLDFRHAYVTTPECCPVRASLLSGGFYAHNTGVIANGGPNGGAPAFDDLEALPVKLWRAGYKTAMIGKYMNGYDEIAPRVPPGWSRFVGTVRAGDWTDFTVVVGSSGASPRTGRVENRSGHIVQYEFDEALSFLEDVGLEGNGDDPFFLLVAPQAPHEPATPQPRDARLFSDYLYRERSWAEADVSDKPRYVRRRARRFNKNLDAKDELHRDQLRTLRTVDRGVEALYEVVARSGELRDTIFVFTSDNGYMWGEHRLEGKNLPYEESIRVPLLVSLAGAATGDIDHLAAMNLDLGATVLDLAGIYSTDKALARHTDGLSFRPFLRGKNVPDAQWRQDLLIQSFTRGFAGLLTRAPLDDVQRPRRAGWTWKYIEHEGGNPREAYRSDVDRFETESLDEDPTFRALYQAPLAERLHELMGLYMVTDNLPAATVGEKYKKGLSAIGAGPPYTWSVVSGTLPPGVRLQGRKGTLVGKPRREGTFEFSVRVEAGVNARYTKKPQAFTRSLRLRVRERGRA